MSIITISRGCCSHGKEIAEEVAHKLGYECVSQEIIFEAASSFHLPEEKLMESIHDAPGILDKITRAREKFITFFQAALLEHLKKDNVVYHGYAGYLFVPAVPHLLKVLVMAEMEDRITFLQKKEKMSRNSAVEFIRREDKNRADWYRYMSKADMNDPRLYDLVINIGRLDVQDACRIISTAATSETRKATPESKKSFCDLALNYHVKAALQDICDPVAIAQCCNRCLRKIAPIIELVCTVDRGLDIHLIHRSEKRHQVVLGVVRAAAAWARYRIERFSDVLRVILG